MLMQIGTGTDPVKPSVGAKSWPPLTLEEQQWVILLLGFLY